MVVSKEAMKKYAQVKSKKALQSDVSGEVKVGDIMLWK